MGRKGDITSKVIGVRTPIKIVTKLMNEASEKGISLSEYCVSLLSKDNFNQGGQTKIEYQDKWHIDPKLVRENEQLKTRIKEQVVSIENLESKLKETIKDWGKSAKKLATPLGLKVEILNEATLKNQGYGGIIGVGQGSSNPPRLLHISYSPNKARARYAFVGKGITFDTGGLALKPANGMEAMKSDMSGAAAVIGAIFAIAELKLPVAIDAWAPLAENMVSENATRPSDIISIYGGKTVEVLNPDAEGRLVLADALVRAQEVAKKFGGLNGIIDVATLTGAQVVALGTRTSAVMTNDVEFSQQFLEASEKAGEAFWPMPLPEELRASLDSPVADLANIGDRMGGMLVAGLFLKEFIEPDVSWLHLDIAGPSYNEASPHGYTPVGGTGIALRSLVTLVESASSQAPRSA